MQFQITASLDIKDFYYMNLIINRCLEKNVFESGEMQNVVNVYQKVNNLIKQFEEKQKQAFEGQVNNSSSSFSTSSSSSSSTPQQPILSYSKPTIPRQDNLYNNYAVSNQPLFSQQALYNHSLPSPSSSSSSSSYPSSPSFQPPPFQTYSPSEYYPPERPTTQGPMPLPRRS
jgi:hypothetical protein